MTRRIVRWVGLLVVILSVWACSSHVPIHVDRSASSVRSLVTQLPFLVPLLAGASTSPAKPGAKGRGFVVEGASPRSTPTASLDQSLVPAPPSPPRPDDPPEGGPRFAPLGQPIRARLGERASDPIRVETHGTGSVTIRRKGATQTPGQLENGVVYYPGAMPGIDALVVSKRDGVEELLVAHGPEAELVYQMDLPAGWRLQPHDNLGLVEVLDARGTARLRMWANQAWDASGAEVKLRLATHDNQIQLAPTGEVRWPVVVDPVFVDTAKMVWGRSSHTQTNLLDGKVLLTGGLSDHGEALDTAELYDPLTCVFTATASTMTSGRIDHSATILNDGKVLLTGGTGTTNINSFNTAEVYDPSTGQFTKTTSAMTANRRTHTATKLVNGKVLVTGGYDSSTTMVNTAELYDPVTGMFNATASPMSAVRGEHKATILDDGKVLVVGGKTASNVATKTAEVYDPATEQFTPTTSTMTASRRNHTATKLDDGKVLVAGGRNSQGYGLDTAELYDPATGLFTQAAFKMTSKRFGYTATKLDSGKILLMGGYDGQATSYTAELYDPMSGSFSATGAKMNSARYFHATTKLGNGKVLVTGGSWRDDISTIVFSLDLAEEYDPAWGRFSPTKSKLGNVRSNHTATLLEDGKVLISGGSSSQAFSLDTAEVYDPATGLFSPTVSTMVSPRIGHTATKLDNGKVFIAGGYDNQAGSTLGTAELYDPATGRFSATTFNMTFPRRFHTAAKLANGKVLVLGGAGELVDALDSAEIYDPTTGAFSMTAGSMSAARDSPTATTLDDGTVLIAGGGNALHTSLDTAELYDPASGLFFTTPGKMTSGRAAHTATKLNDGKVLLTGGFDAQSNIVRTAEVYDPATGTFAATPVKMISTREGHAAAKLTDGRVLVSGGTSAQIQTLNSLEIYDPATGHFLPTANNMQSERDYHTTTTLGDGTVLMVGGRDADLQSLDTAEVFDPVSGTLSSFTSAAVSGGSLSETFDGRLLLAGGDKAGSHPALLSSDGSQTSGSGIVKRAHHSALVLPDGSTLFIGGVSSGGTFLDTFESITLDGTTTRSGNLTHARAYHTATRLPDGRVLVAGGEDDNGSLSSCEVIDPDQLDHHDDCTLLGPRSRHAAALLLDGRVLLVGGENLNGDVVLAEVFDPVTLTVSGSGQAAVGPNTTLGFLGEANVVSSPLGPQFDQKILFAGSTKSVRFESVSNAFLDLDLAPSPWIATLSTGSALACNETTCRVLGRASSSGGLADAMSLATDDRLKAMGTASLVVAGARGNGEWLSWGSILEPDTVRPEIFSLPKDVWLSGETGTIEGKGWPVLNTPKSPSSLADSAVLAWKPLDSVGPVHVFQVSRWGDGTVDFTIPSTVYTGPGWLYVMLGGVPSEGRLMTILPALKGQACQIGGQCTTGFCVEGVCCDQKCEDGCLSCLGAKKASGQDGICGPIAPTGKPRFGCVNLDGGACGFSGVCNGAGSCDLPGIDKICNDQGYRCQAGVCTEAPKNTCGENNTEVVSVSGNRPCAPFKCSDGECLTTCGSHADCALGYHCNAALSCEPSTPIVDAADPGGCSSHPRPRAPSRGHMLVLALFAMGAHKNRRRRFLTQLSSRCSILVAPTRGVGGFLRVRGGVVLGTHGGRLWRVDRWTTAGPRRNTRRGFLKVPTNVPRHPCSPWWGCRTSLDRHDRRPFKRFFQIWRREHSRSKRQCRRPARGSYAAHRNPSSRRGRWEWDWHCAHWRGGRHAVLWNGAGGLGRRGARHLFVLRRRSTRIHDNWNCSGKRRCDTTSPVQRCRTYDKFSSQLALPCAVLVIREEYFSGVVVDIPNAELVGRRRPEQQEHLVRGHRREIVHVLATRMTKPSPPFARHRIPIGIARVRNRKVGFVHGRSRSSPFNARERAALQRLREPPKQQVAR